MKGLKKLALASAISAVAVGAQAELKALDDSAMGELTGQAGLTIDLETKVSIGQFMYKDAGSLFIQDISIGGNANTTDSNLANDTGMLDNIRMNIDIAGSAATGENQLDRGLSDFYGAEGLAAVALAYGAVDDGRLAALAGGIEGATGGNSLKFLESNGAGSTTVAAVAAATGGTFVKGRVGIENGDLVIHEIATDPLAALISGQDLIDNGATALSGFTTDQVIHAAVTAVDFKFTIGAIGLADSDYVAGEGVYNPLNGDLASATSVTTTLISGLSIAGYLGHKDIHIENNGNGFGGVDADGNGRIGAGEYGLRTDRGDADSKIHMDSYFNITDLDVYIDIAGVQINDLKIMNTRGDTTGLDGLNAFGFAHSMRDIFAVKDTVLNLATAPLAPGSVAPSGSNIAGFVDGIAINTTSKFDMDIGSLSFGDTGTSIGEIYLTDVTNTTNWTISAH